jgi:hypothetical protein
MVHYHIRWSTKGVLDWEAFDSREEAEASAQELVRLGETYTIEERDDNCPRCWKSFHIRQADPNPNEAYSWQQTLLDAFNEPNAQQRVLKVTQAQRSISARLAESIDSNEQAAIRAALRTLRLLVPERKEPKDESGEKKDIA